MTVTAYVYRMPLRHRTAVYESAVIHKTLYLHMLTLNMSVIDCRRQLAIDDLHVIAIVLREDLPAVYHPVIVSGRLLGANASGNAYVQTKTLDIVRQPTRRCCVCLRHPVYAVPVSPH